MTLEVLEFLRYGALAISAFCLFLSFFLVRAGNRSNAQVFGFMIFSALIFVGSMVADKNSGLMGLAGQGGINVVPQPEAVRVDRASVSSQGSQFWDSGWFSVEDGKEYELQHQMTSEPLTATIWYKRESSGDIHMMDGIYENGGGYGAWIMNLNSKSLVIATGDNGSSSGYGHYNHWAAIDQGAKSGSVPRFLRVVVSY